MAFRPLRGQTVAQLLAARTVAVEDYLSRKTLSSYDSGSVSASKVIESTPEQVIQAIDYELYNLDPVTYPLNKRVTRTRVSVAQSEPV